MVRVLGLYIAEYSVQCDSQFEQSTQPGRPFPGMLPVCLKMGGWRRMEISLSFRTWMGGSMLDIEVGEDLCTVGEWEGTERNDDPDPCVYEIRNSEYSPYSIMKREQL